MNIELRFLQKAIENKNYISFSYEMKKLDKIKPLSLIQKDELYFLNAVNKTFEFTKITKLQICKDQF